MKNSRRIIKARDGMTYVEVLVAISILALVVLTFTPALLMSYNNIYNAGEITENTYEQKQKIESRLALRDVQSDEKFTVKTFFEDLEDSIDTIMYEIKSNVRGLDTVYGSLKRKISIVSSKTIYDDSSVARVSIYFKNLDVNKCEITTGIEALSEDERYSNDKDTTIINVSCPASNTGNVTVDRIEADEENDILTLVLSELDVTKSPIRIAAYFYNEYGSKQSPSVQYIEIFPSHIMFVGKADGNATYYTSEGVANGAFNVEARSMLSSNGMSVSGAVFNKVRWIPAGVDGKAANGYYAMCGNNGIIRRLWKITEDENTKMNQSDVEKIGYAKVETTESPIYRNSWGGDYTESYRYDVYDGGTSSSNDGIWRDSSWVYGSKAITMTKYSGYNLTNKNMYTLPSTRCIALSRVLADDSSIINGIESGQYVTIPDSVRTKTESVNWVGNDGKARYGDDVDDDYTYTGCWTNVGNGAPIVFLTTNGEASGIYRVAQCSDRGSYIADGNFYRKNVLGAWGWIDDAKCWFSSSGAQLTRNWNEKIMDGHIPRIACNYKYSNHYCAYCDVGATFNNYVFSAPGKTTYNFNSPAYNSMSLNQKQSYIKSFVLDYFADSNSPITPTTSHLDNTDTKDAGDNGLSYVRLKAYSNLKNADVGLMLSKNNNNIKNEEQSEADSEMKATVNLTDIMYIDSDALTSNNDGKSANHVNYVGYSAASALVYSTTPANTTNAHDTSKAYKLHLLKGSINGGYEVRTGTYSDHIMNVTESVANSLLPDANNDSDTFLTLGYSSKRAMFYDTSASIAKSTMENLATATNGLDTSHGVYADDFATITAYASSPDLLVGVGYTTASYAKTDAALVYNCKNPAHTNIGSAATLDFVNGNSMFGKTSGTSYMFVDSANPGRAEDGRSMCLLKAPTCACAYTAVNEIAVNEGLLAVKTPSEETFSYIYYQKKVNGKDVRLTAAAIAPETNGTNFLVFAGDNNGNLYIYEVNATTSPATVTAVSGACSTGLKSIKAIYRNEDKLFVCGQSTLGAQPIVVYELSSTTTNLSKIISKKNTSGTHSADVLYDIISHKDYYYAVGTNAANTSGVIYHSENGIHWTKADVDVNPLYSVAAQ